MKVNISLNDVILQQLDTYADKHGLKRSAVVTRALGVLFAQDDAQDALRRAAAMADEMEQSKYISDDLARRYKRLLSEIEVLSKSNF